MARINAVAAVLLFAALTVVVFLQVLNRLVLHLPIIWSEEIARFLFFWVVLLGAAMSVRTRRHFVVDVTMGRGRPARGLARLLRAVGPHIVVLAFLVFLLVEGVGYTRTGMLRTATNSGVNMGWVYAAVPVFAAVAIFYTATLLRSDFRALRANGSAESSHPPAE